MAAPTLHVPATVEQAASWFHVPQVTIRTWVRRYGIESVDRVGAAKRYWLDELVAAEKRTGTRGRNQRQSAYGSKRRAGVGPMD